MTSGKGTKRDYTSPTTVNLSKQGQSEGNQADLVNEITLTASDGAAVE